MCSPARRRVTVFTLLAIVLITVPVAVTHHKRTNADDRDPSSHLNSEATPTPSSSDSTTVSISTFISVSVTDSVSISASISSSESATMSETATVTATPSATTTFSPTPTMTSSNSATISITFSITATISRSASVTPSITKSASKTATISTSTSETPAISTSTSFSATTTATISDTASTSITPSVTPSKFPSFTPTIQVANAHTHALASNGSVYVWGNFASAVIKPPTRQPSNSLFSYLAHCPTSLSMCGMTMTGGLRCWGSNANLITGATGPDLPNIPANDLLTTVTSVSVGRRLACAVYSGGAVRCWGYASFLGTGSSGSTYVAAADSVDAYNTGIASVSVGYMHTCAVTTAGGGVRCWGSNSYGESNLAINTPDIVYAAPSTDLITGAVEVSCGYELSCARNNDGSVSCWGYNADGEVGDGTQTFTSNGKSHLNFESNVKQIVVGFQHVCILKSTDDGVYCWGLGTYGALGRSTQANQLSVPVSPVITGVDYVSAGNGVTCVRMISSGGFRCWGRGSNYQLNNGGSSTNVLVPPTTDMAFP